MSRMGSAIWPHRMASWIGCAICGQREKPSSRVGVVRKRSTPENCPKARRPSFCEKTSKAATPSVATMASPRTRPLRSLSVQWSAIRCLCWKANSVGGRPGGNVGRLHALEERPASRSEQRFFSLVNERNLDMPELQTLMTGLAFGESPRWHNGRLWFSDFGAQEVVAVDMEGKSEVITRIQGTPMGLGFLPDGRMLIVSMRDGLLLRREHDGSLVTHADLSHLSRYPWSDMVVDGRGNAYIGNLGFNFPGGEFAPGILILVTPDGTVRQVAKGCAFANGMVVTPNNATLLLAESYGHRLTAFDIEASGLLSNRRVWADLGGGFPDGICLDAEHAIWYADVPARRCVRIRTGGEILQTISLDCGCYACMLVGVDRRTLFLIADEWPPASWGQEAARTGQVLTVQVSVPGVGWP